MREGRVAKTREFYVAVVFPGDRRPVVARAYARMKCVRRRNSRHTSG